MPSYDVAMFRIKILLMMAKSINIVIVYINILRRVFIQRCLSIEFPDNRHNITLSKILKLLVLSYVFYLTPQYDWIGNGTTDRIMQKNEIFGREIYYHYNDIFQIISLSKIYIIFRSYLRMTEYSSTRSKRVW